VTTPPEIAEHGRLLDGPPRGLKYLWVDGIARLLAQYNQARTAEERTSIGTSILLAPATWLRRARGGLSGRRQYATRLRTFSVGAPPPQQAPAHGHGHGQVHDRDAPVQVAAANVEEDLRTISRAAALLRKGKVSRAAKALHTAPRAPCNADTFDKLERLHPQRVDEIPPLPADTPFWNPSGNDEGLRRRITRWLSTGGAPGLSGFSEGMLLPIVENDGTYPALLRLLRDIVNGDVSPALTQLLLASSLVPLTKRDNGVRPIAVGEILVRLSGKIAFSLIREAADEYFGHLQLGCGAVGGAQLAALTLRLAATRPDHAVVSIDVKNAYNTVSRRIIMQRLLGVREFRPTWRMAHWLLASPSALLVMEAGQVAFSLESTTGVRQGCSLSPFLFAVDSRGTQGRQCTTRPGPRNRRRTRRIRRPRGHSGQHQRLGPTRTGGCTHPRHLPTHWSTG
jgi:hypothetical protein